MSYFLPKLYKICLKQLKNLLVLKKFLQNNLHFLFKF